MGGPLAGVRIVELGYGAAVVARLRAHRAVRG